ALLGRLALILYEASGVDRVAQVLADPPETADAEFSGAGQEVGLVELGRAARLAQCSLGPSHDVEVGEADLAVFHRGGAALEAGHGVAYRGAGDGSEEIREFIPGIAIDQVRHFCVL